MGIPDLPFSDADRDVTHPAIWDALDWISPHLRSIREVDTVSKERRRWLPVERAAVVLAVASVEEAANLGDGDSSGIDDWLSGATCSAQEERTLEQHS